MTLFDWWFVRNNRQELERTFEENAQKNRDLAYKMWYTGLSPAQRAMEDQERVRLAREEEERAKQTKKADIVVLAALAYGLIMFVWVVSHLPW